MMMTSSSSFLCPFQCRHFATNPFSEQLVSCPCCWYFQKCTNFFDMKSPKKLQEFCLSEKTMNVSATARTHCCNSKTMSFRSLRSAPFQTQNFKVYKCKEILIPELCKSRHSSQKTITLLFNNASLSTQFQINSKIKTRPSGKKWTYRIV